MVMAAEHHEMNPKLVDWLAVFEYTFTGLYAAEATCKIYGWGARPYFNDGLNQMDFSIVVISLMGPWNPLPYFTLHIQH